jgi:hypothetical protein
MMGISAKPILLLKGGQKMRTKTQRLMITPIQLAIVLAVLVTATALAGAGPLVQVSSESPFENCGNFPGPWETVYLDSEVEPWVVVNPTDPQNIVGFWQQDRWSHGGAKGNVAGVSFDGGATWQIVPVPGITDCTGGPWERASDPWLSFSPDGTLHQMSLVFDLDPPADRPGGHGRNGMAVSKSEDGGLIWSDPILLVDEDKPRYLHDKNSLTADPTDANYVYAVWDRPQIPAGETIDPDPVGPGHGYAKGIGKGWKGSTYFARSTDGGDTWEPARKIYDTSSHDQTIGNQIVVLPDGTLIDFFTEILDPSDYDQSGKGSNLNLALLRSTDKGKTWKKRGGPIYVAEITCQNTITPDEGEWIRDGCILFDVAVDASNGNLYAVWGDNRFRDVEEVAFSMSTDGGFTWSAPIRINQTPADEQDIYMQQAFLPSVEVAADTGIVGVTYYDFRNDNGTGELADHWFVSCAANCTARESWGDEIRLTDASFDYMLAPDTPGGLFLGDYVGLASDGTDFLAFFQQSANIREADGFFRRISP